MNTSKPFNLLTTFRRAVAVMALCVVAAGVGATYLTAAPAQAGPRASSADSSATAHGVRAPSRVRVAERDGKAPGLTVRGKLLTGKLNLNTASEDQLRMLPGIGPSKARRILDYRKQRGKFKRVRDLRRVKGIGYKTMQKLTPHLTVKGETTLKLE